VTEVNCGITKLVKKDCLYKVEALISSPAISCVKTGLKTNILINVLFLSLYGCETWSLMLREEHGLRVFENMVLRRIFGPKSDEVTGEWRKLHSEELHNLYSSQDITRQIKSRQLRWAGHVARMGEERKLYKVLVGKPERKIPLRRPRRRWGMGSECILGILAGGGVDWIQLAQDRDQWQAVVSVVMHLRVLAPRSYVIGVDPEQFSETSIFNSILM
jgi:hypothetical protein